MQIAPLAWIYLDRPLHVLHLVIGAVQIDMDIHININITHYQYELQRVSIV